MCDIDAQMKCKAWAKAPVLLPLKALKPISTCIYIYGNAYFYGNAYIYGNACLYGNACFYGSAYVYGNAFVYTYIHFLGFIYMHIFLAMHICMAMQDGLDGKVLAEELLALESQFRSSSMNPMGGTKMANDWTVTIDGGAGR